MLIVFCYDFNEIYASDSRGDREIFVRVGGGGGPINYCLFFLVLNVFSWQVLLTVSFMNIHASLQPL